MYPAPPPEGAPRDSVADQQSRPLEEDVVVPEYEFTAGQTALFARTAFWMEWFARMCIGFGGAGAILGAMQGQLFLIAEGTASVVIGIYTWYVASGFRKVGRAGGRGVSHLVAAINELGRMYALQLVIVPLLILLGAVVLIVTE